MILQQQSQLLKKTSTLEPHPHPRIKRTESSHVSLWRQIKSSSDKINGRYHHTSVLFQHKLYVYGGFDNDVGVLQDLKVFDCQKCEWQSLGDGPGPRHSHSAGLYNGVMYVFGGKTDRFKSTNAVHAYHIKQKKWQQIDPHDQPPLKKILKQKQKHCKIASQPEQQNEARQKPYSTDSHQSLIIKNKMIICGGFTNNDYTNTIYSFDLDTKVWQCLYNSSIIDQNLNNKHPEEQTSQIKTWAEPKPRSDFSMVSFNNCLYIFAGKNLQTNFNDLWEFDLETKKFTEIVVENVALDQRSGHTSVIYNSFMLIFGGITSVTNERDDLLCFCLETRKWVTVWQNCEDRTVESKANEMKVSSIKFKPSQNMHKSKLQQHFTQQPRKYRRPLAEQKSTNYIKRDRHENSRHKKHNERKFFLINQLQTPNSPHDRTQAEQYSPLIESLTNSIMLTSNAFRSGNSSSRENQKYSDIIESLKNKPKRLKARDGHTAHIWNNQMIVFGGDRHMFAINDVVFVNLDYLMENMELKLKQMQGCPVFAEEESEKENQTQKIMINN